MLVPVINVGNSKAIKLNNDLLQRYVIKDTVDLIFENDQIVIKPLSNPRKGWEKSFIEMNANDDDKLLIDDVFEDDEFEEWK